MVVVKVHVYEKQQFGYILNQDQSTPSKEY